MPIAYFSYRPGDGPPLPGIDPGMLLRPEPEADVVEIALAMAGAVSGGAYAAGVADVLIQALDAWEEARRRGDPLAPPHRVRLRGAAGASAGSMIAAILAVAGGRAFPAVCPANLGDPAATARNPLFRAWVDEIDLARLLGDGDLAPQRAPTALFDSTALDRIGAAIFDLDRDAPPAARPWLADPFQLALTATSLRGRACALDYGAASTAPGGAHWIGLHDEVLRFRIGERPGRGDERRLRWPCSTADPAWRSLLAAALASAAFPGGLAPRPIDLGELAPAQRIIHLGADAAGGHRFAALPLTAPEAGPGPGSFLAVDGGALANEPIELARTMLCGLAGRNDRSGQARRATILIDPFIGLEGVGGAAYAGALPADAPRSGQRWLPDLLARLLSVEINQNRASVRDLALAWDESIHSRYLIAPNRPPAPVPPGAVAAPLASACLGAFGGFLDRSFRVHDYLLGRVNGQRFLKRHFRLPADNPVFARWTDAQRAHFRYGRDDDGKLPVIPLLPAAIAVDGGTRRVDLAEDEPMPAWPGPLAGDRVRLLERLIRQRLDGLFAGARWRLGIDGVGGWAADQLWRQWGAGRAQGAIRDAIDRDLRRAGLGGFDRNTG